MNTSIYPDNILGLMFKLLDAAMNVANIVVSNLMKTPTEIMLEKLQESNVPEWLSGFLERVLKWNAPLIADVSLFDFLIGSVLFIVLVVGIAKYFGDLFGL